MQALVPPGGGPPPHIHTREKETFYVLEGNVEFLLGEQTVVAGPGDFVNVPRGTVHRFQNTGTATARIILIFTRALGDQIAWGKRRSLGDNRGRRCTIETGPPQGDACARREPGLRRVRARAAYDVGGVDRADPRLARPRGAALSVGIRAQSLDHGQGKRSCANGATTLCPNGVAACASALMSAPNWPGDDCSRAAWLANSPTHEAVSIHELLLRAEPMSRARRL
jgi:hypothetical protein